MRRRQPKYLGKRMSYLQSVLRVLFYIAVGGVISIVGAAFFFMNWEPDRAKHPLRGIDVSHHQGAIDWQQVAGDDIAFVYMKATEGGDFKDSAFAENWRSASQAGLVWGAYHFFSLCKAGAAQADNFLNSMPRDVPMLAPVLDLEFEGNCNRRPMTADVLKEIGSYVARVEEGMGKSVIFYVSQAFFETYLKDEALNRRLWARSIWHSPSYGTDWTIWQYHQRGQVNGIAGDVDLNVLAEDMTLERLSK